MSAPALPPTPSLPRKGGGRGKRPGGVIRGSTVLAILLAAFAIILGANGTMIWLAVTSSPGLVTDKAFERGKFYNRELAAAAAADALGWTTALDWREGRAELRVTNRTGAPVEGLAARLTVLRPVEKVAPIELTLRESAPGTYDAALTLPRAGQWELQLVASRGAEMIAATKRIVVR
jgi:nitrogen fixation protein FixH